jgi:DNA (cytosine-5)-methyltransferase 1
VSAVYYNEFDPYAAEWLRNLIAAAHIAPGVVDTRSIEDVHPNDLRDFTQCHFFAGIGVWSYALRAAGWADDRPVWTGSCPCQPFSAAGEGAGFADERHLWPAFHHLIRECKPASVLGEQVASKDADPWVDLVHTDMEALGYAFGAVPFPSAGVGAPHIRDRLYWVANAKGSGGRAKLRCVANRTAARVREPQRENIGRPGKHQRESIYFSPTDGLANTHGRHACAERQQRSGEQRQQPQDGGAMRLADAGNGQRHGLAVVQGFERDRKDSGRTEGGSQLESCGDACGPSPTNGFWRTADWLGCTDGKWRPVEPGTSPLADGAPARVGRLRAYGNAINAEAARVFIEAVMECAP